MKEAALLHAAVGAGEGGCAADTAVGVKAKENALQHAAVGVCEGGCSAECRGDAVSADEGNCAAAMGASEKEAALLSAA